MATFRAAHLIKVCESVTGLADEFEGLLAVDVYVAAGSGFQVVIGYSICISDRGFTSTAIRAGMRPPLSRNGIWSFIRRRIVTCPLPSTAIEVALAGSRAVVGAKLSRRPASEHRLPFGLYTWPEFRNPCVLRCLRLLPTRLRLDQAKQRPPGARKMINREPPTTTAMLVHKVTRGTAEAHDNCFFPCCRHVIGQMPLGTCSECWPVVLPSWLRVGRLTVCNLHPSYCALKTRRRPLLGRWVECSGEQ